MNPLSIREALKLYFLLSPYIPEIQANETGLEFVGKIIDNIKLSDSPRDYLEAVSLMSGLPVQDMLNGMPSEEILTKFVEGIKDNKVLLLRDFCRKVGWNG